MKTLANIVVALSVFISLAVATSFLVLSTELAHREELTQLRGPAFVSTEKQATLAWSIDGTSFNGRPVSVLYFSPRDESVTPPPGLTQWPAPGEAAVSPGLAAHPEFVESQFGSISETISDAVLLNQDELVVYVRPTDDSLLWSRAEVGDRAYFGSGFNVMDSGVAFGDSLYENNAGKLFPLLLVSLLPPTLLLIALMRSLCRTTTARNQYILQAIGASRPSLTLTLWSTFWPGLTCGVATGFVGQLILMRKTAAIPFASFTLTPGALQDRLGTVILIDLLIVIVIALLICLPTTRLQPEKKKQRRSRSRNLGATTFGIGLLLVATGTVLLLKTALDLQMYFWLGGILLVCCGLFSVLSLLVRTVGERFSRSSARNIVFRWMSPHSDQVALAAAITGGFAIIGSVIAMLYVSVNSFSDSSFDREAENHIATTNISCRVGDTECLGGLLQDVEKAAPDAYVFSVISKQGGGEAVVERTDTSAALEQVQGNLRMFVDDTIAGMDRVDVADAAFERGQIFAVSPTGTLRLEDFRTIRATNTERLPFTGWYGSGDAAATSIYEHQSRWIMWSLGFSFLIVLASTTVTSVLRTRQEALEMIPIASLTGEISSLARSLFQRSTIIAVCSSGFSLVIALLICMQVGATTSINIPFPFVLILGALLAVSVLIEGIVGRLTLHRVSKTWMPGKNVSA